MNARFLMLATLALLVFGQLASLKEASAGENRAAGDTASHCESATPRDPSTAALIGVGLPMLLGDFFLQDTLHEGSHCLMTEMVGGHCLGIKIWPSKNENGNWTMGETYWSNINGENRELAVLLAPKATDLLMLGGYTALLET